MQQSTQESVEAALVATNCTVSVEAALVATNCTSRDRVHVERLCDTQLSCIHVILGYHALMSHAVTSPVTKMCVCAVLVVSLWCLCGVVCCLCGVCVECVLFLCCVCGGGDFSVDFWRVLLQNDRALSQVFRILVLMFRAP